MTNTHILYQVNENVLNKWQNLQQKNDEQDFNSSERQRPGKPGFALVALSERANRLYFYYNNF